MIFYCRRKMMSWVGSCSVQDLCESGIEEVPKEYIQPARNEFASLGCDGEGINIPVIDYAKLQAADAEEVSKFVDACKEWGFFQLANHGIPEDLVIKTQQVAKQFFYLPSQEKQEYFVATNQLDAVAIGYSRISFLNEESPQDWGDTLVIDVDANTEIDTWPKKPEAFREIILQYSKEITSLGTQLLNITTLSLGLPEQYVENNFGEVGLLLSANFYPRCPQPDLVLGLSTHSDPQFLTLLFQDVEGLHVLRDDRWTLVKPRHNHFVVNVGDQTEILSNGKYKSSLHRVTVNNERDRLSIAAFLRPPLHAVVGPAPCLIDDSHPTQYSSVKYGEFYSSAYGSLGKRNLESHKV
ncbi:hypothetical protein O6H91_02G052400 [Diphasiastrum complanatum]|uniref:Uncharacterized protein n=1 Tax=Diphasiastrum complanatum TaxID=34168 RepID=A0ACC2EFT0_DIPCM|nr:hypothetical protein O6H91_02G052400 [Diphasiastrum complanatum]